MHEGYFVGRKELTNWIRQNFEPAFQKVEDLANGVVYCQILNTIYPGAIQMSKVKMTAKTEVDFIHNFKVRPNCRQMPTRGGCPLAPIPSPGIVASQAAACNMPVPVFTQCQPAACTPPRPASVHFAR